jgi:septum site-determining protein MinC
MVAGAPAVAEDECESGTGSPARLLTQPVRSGRQVYAHGGDLVVMSSISPGAELLADGHIHVYGALRGRALAGVSGDTTARIFCRSLEAELVSVAGFWRVRENIPETLIGKPAQVFLEGDRIAIEPLA